jgi:hypothetical protein
MTAGITWLDSASHSCRHCRIRRHPTVVGGWPSQTMVPPDRRTIRIADKRAGYVRAGQPVGDVFARPHHPGDQAAHLVGTAAVQPLRQDGAEQAAAQLISDAVADRLGGRGQRRRRSRR